MEGGREIPVHIIGPIVDSDQEKVKNIRFTLNPFADFRNLNM